MFGIPQLLHSQEQPVLSPGKHLCSCPGSRIVIPSVACVTTGVFHVTATVQAQRGYLSVFFCFIS